MVIGYLILHRPHPRCSLQLTFQKLCLLYWADRGSVCRDFSTFIRLAAVWMSLSVNRKTCSFFICNYSLRRYLYLHTSLGFDFILSDTFFEKHKYIITSGLGNEDPLSYQFVFAITNFWNTFFRPQFPKHRYW